MWTIRQEQLEQLSSSVRSELLRERVRALSQKISECAPKLAALHTSAENSDAIREAVLAASQVGIAEFDDQYSWALWRIESGEPFWADKTLQPMLSDNLIHPRAKARYALMLSQRRGLLMSSRQDA